MKKLNKLFLSISAISFGLLMFLEVMPKTVKADGTFDVVIPIQVSNESDVTLAARGASGVLANNTEGDGLVGFRGGNQYIIGFDDTYTNTGFANQNVKVTCTNDKNCVATVTVPNEHGVKVTVGGDTPFKFLVDGNEYDNSPLPSNKVVEIINKDNQSTAFDGKAYLVWSCSNKVCYRLIEGLSNNVTFIKASTIKDTNDESKKFDVHADQKFFASTESFETKKAQIDANTVSIDSLIGPDGIDYMPVGEPTSNNAYTSYGDRNFKVTIYNDDYRGVSLGSLNDLTYYPSAWTDDLARIESYDISGTSKDNPIDIETVLLESTINIKPLSNYNSFEISKIEALDVPDNAVTITKVNGEYKIKFNSNFYDKVVFKVTSTDNKVYYFRINRLTIDVRNDEITYRPDVNNLDLTASFYFDRTTSYEDYNLTLKIEYKDGTTKVVNMENAKAIDDGFGNVTYAYEVDDQVNHIGPSEGKGLKISTYKYTFKNGEVKKINKVYINAEYKGSTKTNYAGAFAGSGKGIVITFKEGR